MFYSSQKAIDLVVGFEIGSKAAYDKAYKHPTWPSGKSGVTIGIGYDLGYTTQEEFQKDFGGSLSDFDFTALSHAIGVTGEAAHSLVSSLRAIEVKWEDAMRVFTMRDVPKYEQMLIRACPDAVKLPPDCFGALFSIVYNRGAGGFHADGDRFKEMRTIATLIMESKWALIPAQIRAMKRLWPNNDERGLLIRRDKEAELFEQGLGSATSTGTAPASAPVEDHFQSAMSGEYNITVELLQTKLEDKLGYFEVGEVDGKWGGRTRGAITAFMNDRHQPTNGLLTTDVMNEINAALKEGWKRPIADTRSQATADDVSKKTPVVNQTFWNKLWATLLGVPSAFAALVKFIFGDQATPSAYIDPIKTAFASIPPELYLFVVAGICVAVFVQAKRAQDTTVEAYRQGKIN